ncbi:MAG: ABC transporter substrate-binding protein, partial [Candidatus Hydrothermarchaeales archaeon]
MSYSLPRRRFLKICAKAGLLFVGAGTVGCIAKKEGVSLPKASLLPKVKGQFIEGVTGGDAETLNWILAADAASFGYVGLTMDGLITYNNKIEVELRWLDEDIEVSADGLEYMVKLRDDLWWTGGRQVTSEDFVYIMKNLMFSDWLNYNYKGDWQEVVDGEQVYVEPRVVDKTTLSIVRQTVDPTFYFTVTDLTAYPKHIVQKYEGDVEAFTQAEELNNLSYTGNLGPYRFSEWIRGDKFVVERNPDYYLGQESGAPYFEKYITKIFGTSAAMHVALEAGDIMYAGVEPDQAKKFKELQTINIHTVPTRSYTLMDYNQRANGWEGLRKKEVRQALSMAVDKVTLINSVRYGFGEPAFSFIPKTSPWYVEEGLMKFGVGELFDKNEAKRILIEEGYEPPIKLTLVTSTGSKTAENVSLFVKQELAEIGVEVETKFVPGENLWRKYSKNKVSGSDQPLRFNSGPDAVSEEPWDLMLYAHGTDL